MTTPISILFVGLIGGAIALTALSYLFRKPVLAFSGGGLWLFVAIQAYQLSAAAWDLYYGLFFFSMGMLIVCCLEPMVMRQRDEAEIPMRIYGDDEDEEADEMDVDADEALTRLERQGENQALLRSRSKRAFGGIRGRRSGKVKRGKFSDKRLRRFEEAGDI